MNPFSQKRFFHTAVGLAVALFIGEVILGVIGNPVQDVYRGTVSIGEEYGKNMLINDVEMSVDIPSNRSILRAPIWAERGDINITFTGNGVDAMKKLGYSVEQSKGESYVQLSCTVRNSITKGYWASYARYFELVFTSDSPCKSMKMGATNFDKFEVFTTAPSGVPIFAHLNRDSRVGIIQRLIMRFNYKTTNYGGEDTFR